MAANAHAAGSAGVSTKDLKRNLSRKDLLVLALGQIVGAGILTMLGIAVGMTGRSVFLALIISAIFISISLIPVLFAGGTVRFRGGDYSRAALLGGEKWAGIYIICFIATNVSISMYAISFADYLLALVPGMPHKLVSVAIVSLIFMLHYTGTKNAARFQSILILFLATAFALFTGFGLFHLEPGFFSQPGFLTHGLGGLISAGAYMTFAVGGAQLLINYSGEAKNPTKDIPIVMVGATLGVAVLYGLMSIVASGVLPLGQVANQPLTLVAKEVLPGPLFVFFVVCGALFGLTGTMNSQIGGTMKPVMQACVDGWFPQSMAKLHPKFKTPTRLLGAYYLIAVLPIIIGWDISLISNTVLIIFNAIMMCLAILTTRLPKLEPEAWEASRFKVSQKTLTILSWLSGLALLAQILILAKNLSIWAMLGNVALLVFAYLFGTMRAKHVNMEESIERS